MIWKPHTTVAAVVEHDDKFLCVEESVAGQMVINQPAGHLEPGEDLIEAVIRETQEETAWTFEPTHITGIYTWQHPKTKESFIRFTFTGKLLEHDSERPLDKDIDRVVWLTYDELKKQAHLRSPMVVKSVEDYLAGHRFPVSILTYLD